MKYIDVKTDFIKNIEIRVRGPIEELNGFANFQIEEDDIEKYKGQEAVIVWKIKEEDRMLKVEHYLYVNGRRLEHYDAVFTEPHDIIFSVGSIIFSLWSLR